MNSDSKREPNAAPSLTVGAKGALLYSLRRAMYFNRRVVDHRGMRGFLKSGSLLT